MDLHGYIEGKWEDQIKRFYPIDEDNDRFFYDHDGYPSRAEGPGIDQEYQSSILKTVEDELRDRRFVLSWGEDNNNVDEDKLAISGLDFL
jgi:hypothetical protein